MLVGEHARRLQGPLPTEVRKAGVLTRFEPGDDVMLYRFDPYDFRQLRSCVAGNGNATALLLL